ncbi:MAG: hypothetical protein KAG89_02435 [Fulvimarina manganoxydans]|uniref:hypothetical protein n=1 Tax=Fulvimarina manganoxydans TaxID=937218 RepID=UPI002355F61B|nr:hypothetical protein [Fulvimarina manganoxydans]MCK5931002.1 hypothetical protein [Fulvimarina manganoxydans]
MRDVVKDAGAEVRSRLREMVDAVVERLKMLWAWAFGRPYVPAPMLNRAAAAVDRVEREPAAEPKDDDMPVRRMPTRRPSLGERVKLAAELMRHDRTVGTGLLDPADAAEKQILDWLVRYRLESLDTIASTPAMALQLHVTGERRHPLLPGMNEPERGEPLDIMQWGAWLQNFDRQRGNDDPDANRIRRLAEILAEDGYSVQDLIRQARRGRAA